VQVRSGVPITPACLEQPQDRSCKPADAGATPAAGSNHESHAEVVEADSRNPSLTRCKSGAALQPICRVV
jgi:hypothetical protein